MDLYQILQVAEDATREDIRAAYLVLVQESHPDRRNAAPDLAELATESRFKRIQEAFEILHDPARRAEYDRARLRPVVPGGGMVVTPVGPGIRRDIPMHWLHRSGPSRRSKRRAGRWILLALVLAMVVVFLSLRSHLIWSRLSSRAADVPATSRSAARARQVAVAPANVPAEVQHQIDEIVDVEPGGVDPGEDTPAVDPAPPDEQDRAETLVEESAAVPRTVEESLSSPYWDPSLVDPWLVDAAFVPPAMHPPFVGTFTRFEPATYDAAVIMQASWQFEDPQTVLSGYPPITASAPLPPATVVLLPINTDSQYLLDVPTAEAIEAAMVFWHTDEPILGSSLQGPLADELPISMVMIPPSLGETVPTYSLAEMQLDPVELGGPVNVPVPSEQVPPSNASWRQPPVLKANPHRQINLATNKWETFRWSGSEIRNVPPPRGDTPWTSRRQTSIRNGLDSENWNATSRVRPPTLNEIQQPHSPRSVSQMGAAWSPSPPMVDSPTSGIRPEPFGLNRFRQFDPTPPSPVPHIGDSFHDRRERGPYDKP